MRFQSIRPRCCRTQIPLGTLPTPKLRRTTPRRRRRGSQSPIHMSIQRRILVPLRLGGGCQIARCRRWRPCRRGTSSSGCFPLQTGRGRTGQGPSSTGGGGVIVQIGDLGVIVQTNVLEVGDIGEDTIGAGQLRGRAKGGRFGGFGAGQLGRGIGGSRANGRHFIDYLAVVVVSCGKRMRARVVSLGIRE